MSSIIPFKIAIPDEELDLLHQKLKLTRFPKKDPEWTEENGMTTQKLREIHDFWLNEYDWRSEERQINLLPQFITEIEVDGGFGVLDVHFVHVRGRDQDQNQRRSQDEIENESRADQSSSPSTNVDNTSTVAATTTTTTPKTSERIPLLFVHGWPGSFLEIEKGLPLLLEAGFDVVAPSLPGYGFSSYTRKHGFDHRQHAEMLNKLMLKLGYRRYVVQGGDWGSAIVRAMGLLYPDNVVGVHQNMLQTPNLDYPPKNPEKYTASEHHNLQRAHEYFLQNNCAYSQIFAQRPQTTGWGLTDSPIGLLTNFADKLITWSDNYPWTPTELITWTLIHWFSTADVTASLIMYHENNPPACMIRNSWANKYLVVPCGYSSFPKEIIMVPKSWADQVGNCVFYKTHSKGGHFAMWECPDVLVRDLVEFFHAVWKDTAE